MNNGIGDPYKRQKAGPDTYQCGCKWVRNAPEHVAHGVHGDVLVECPLHNQATEASLRKFERGRKAGG